MDIITKEWIYETIKNSGDDPRYDPPNSSYAAGVIFEKIQKEFAQLQLRDDELTRLEEAGVDNWIGY